MIQNRDLGDENFYNKNDCESKSEAGLLDKLVIIGKLLKAKRFAGIIVDFDQNKGAVNMEMHSYKL